MDEVCILNIAGATRVAVPNIRDSISAYIVLEQEDWFEDEIRFVRRWLKPGMRAMDVGANVGVYTVAMAKAVGSSGHVWAFEPTPATAECLKQSLDANQFDNVTLVRAAVSEIAGTTDFSLGTHAEENAVAKTGGAGQEVLRVEAVTLDQMAADRGCANIDLVKLDVEGHEFEVIRGATAFLRTNSPLLMFEIRAGATVDLRVLKPLAELGYGFYRLLPGMLCLEPFDQRQALDGYQLNLFACKPERRLQLAADGFLAVPDLARAVTTAPQAWRTYAREAVYAQRLTPHWPSNADSAADEGEKAQMDGLAAFAQSRDPARTLAERVESLWYAVGRVARAIQAKDTLARRVSLARLTWETGMRGAAIVSLSKAANRMKAEAAQAVAEPFLAPSQRYERLPVDAPAGEWLESAVIEQYEKLRNFSSVFGGTSSLAVLEPLLGRPYCSPEMERRRQLVRMRAGLQEHPEPNPALCLRSPENLNPEFWCAGGSAQPK
jgi:FkbM family methyltransferase